mmetsp:Transcript_29549/g.52917  ORF Transcript_29549/g.52917 Transcript_29549/m.52917 type:complete len:277 (-) Transcript_29549:195-1025(-)
MGLSSFVHCHTSTRPSFPRVMIWYASSLFACRAAASALYCHRTWQIGSRCVVSVLLEQPICVSPSRLRSHTTSCPLKVPPAINAGCLGWKAQHMRQLSVSSCESGRPGSRSRRTRFQLTSAPGEAHHPSTSWRPSEAATTLPLSFHATPVTTSWCGLGAPSGKQRSSCAHSTVPSRSSPTKSGSAKAVLRRFSARISSTTGAILSKKGPNDSLIAPAWKAECSWSSVSSTCAPASARFRVCVPAFRVACDSVCAEVSANSTLCRQLLNKFIELSST